MKTVSNTLWVMGAVIVVVGAFFKIMHYPGSSAILMTGYISAGAGMLVALIAGKKTKAS